jgi:hypothetical protein
MKSNCCLTRMTHVYLSIACILGETREHKNVIHDDCGHNLTANWLALMDVMNEDSAFLTNKIAFRYEEFVLHYRHYLNRIFSFAQLDEDSTVFNHIIETTGHAPVSPARDLSRHRPLRHIIDKLDAQIEHERSITPVINRQAQGRRRLLDFHGPGKRNFDTDIEINAEMVWDWKDEWYRKHFDLQRPECVRLIADFEARVNAYGYSLSNVTTLLPITQAISSFLLTPPSHQ